MSPLLAMDKHIQPRIDNDQLRYALLTKGAQIERKHIGYVRGLKKVVTNRNKYYLYNS